MSPSKGPKGELALDIILEKEVQELLGISCAFEQAVQRLSTSVMMVTKGVLTDHLLLLANSMTCAGTFIGFNAGGIKSLSKSLGVQVPFMNATLFTPRKCFEKAAEKCHADNLSNIVASCAWGKHVTVGTASPFEILWDTRKAELSTNKEFQRVLNIELSQIIESCKFLDDKWDPKLFDPKFCNASQGASYEDDGEEWDGSGRYSDDEYWEDGYYPGSTAVVQRRFSVQTRTRMICAFVVQRLTVQTRTIGIFFQIRL
ncbi:hypothetical protein CASFOL_004446 [Castilleja foliolosa]|uniref:DNA-directed RNA polymerase n=1 Tax=Castilleja foliolosa TaxID=1961234 RepID=A0ABD3EE83_9LAMI